MTPTESRPSWYRKIEFFAVRWLNQEINSALTRWRNGLRDEQAPITLAFAALSLGLLSFWAFDQGWWFGTVFLLSATGAALRGHVLIHPMQLFGVAIAVSIGFHLLPELRNGFWQALWEGELLAALVLAGLYWYFRSIKNRVETGDVGEEFVDEDLDGDEFFEDELDEFDDGL